MIIRSNIRTIYRKKLYKHIIIKYGTISAKYSSNDNFVNIVALFTHRNARRHTFYYTQQHKNTSQMIYTLAFDCHCLAFIELNHLCILKGTTTTGQPFILGYKLFYSLGLVSYPTPREVYIRNGGVCILVARISFIKNKPKGRDVSQWWTTTNSQQQRRLSWLTGLQCLRFEVRKESKDEQARVFTVGKL